MSSAFQQTAELLTSEITAERVRVWGIRSNLAKYTDISEDRNSGVITITITDRDPYRAAQLARAYVEEFDCLVAEVPTSSARRERIFVEQRLQTVNRVWMMRPGSSANARARILPSTSQPRPRQRSKGRRGWRGN